MPIDVLLIAPMSDDLEYAFSRSRHTVSWVQARLGAENVKKVEFLGYWNKNDLIVQGHVAVGDEIVDNPGSEGINKLLHHDALLLEHLLIDNDG
jgi:hypothetical protein